MIERHLFASFSDAPTFSVEHVERETTVPAVTIRDWEHRYGLKLSSHVHGHGTRFSERDVARIRWLHDRIENEMSVKQAVAMLRAIEAEPQDAAMRPNLDITQTAQLFKAALLGFDSALSKKLFDQAQAQYPLEEFCAGIVEPVLVSLGDDWAHGKISIEQEHFASNFIRGRILANIHALPHTHHNARRALAACAPEEQHEIGLLIIMLMLGLRGWEVVYLGQRVASARVADTIMNVHPHIVLLSASIKANALRLGTIAAAVQEIADHPPLIVFGGRAFSDHPELASLIPGMFVAGSAHEVAQTIDELVPAEE